jgi:hypothetical protein
LRECQKEKENNYLQKNQTNNKKKDNTQDNQVAVTHPTDKSNSSTDIPSASTTGKNSTEDPPEVIVYY